MKHSIIIANRNRNEYLAVCVETLRRSAEFCGVSDWEVVVGTDSETIPVIPGPVCHVKLVQTSKAFNKPRLLNAAIAHATGDVLTFLDADALVPPRFMDNANRLTDPLLTKVCYRVRRIDMPTTEAIMQSPDFDDVDLAFAKYSSWKLCHEGYRYPHINGVHVPRPPAFGNSQFSIRRDTLGDLRFDEDYLGRGYEDLDFNLQIWQRHFDWYVADLVTDADHALLHLANPPTVNEDWGEGNYNNLNAKRYARKFNLWRREMKAKGSAL